MERSTTVYQDPLQGFARKNSARVQSPALRHTSNIGSKPRQGLTSNIASKPKQGLASNVGSKPRQRYTNDQRGDDTAASHACRQRHSGSGIEQRCANTRCTLAFKRPWTRVLHLAFACRQPRPHRQRWQRRVVKRHRLKHDMCAVAAAVTNARAQKRASARVATFQHGRQRVVGAGRGRRAAAARAPQPEARRQLVRRVASLVEQRREPTMVVAWNQNCTHAHACIHVKVAANIRKLAPSPA
eukprot:365219-Chlamydomonas_euryale.AAC.51